jgi:hypothetical protein
MLGGAPAEAAVRLLRAFALARRTGSGASDAESAQIKYREVLARLQAGDADGAASAATELLSPHAAGWVPAAVSAELNTLLIAHSAVRSKVDTLLEDVISLPEPRAGASADGPDAAAAIDLRPRG